MIDGTPSIFRESVTGSRISIPMEKNGDVYIEHYRSIGADRRVK